MATIVRPEVTTYQQYIDGEWTASDTGKTFEVINPSTEEVVALAPAGGREDAQRAIAAARLAEQVLKGRLADLKQSFLTLTLIGCLPWLAFLAIYLGIKDKTSDKASNKQPHR